MLKLSTIFALLMAFLLASPGFGAEVERLNVVYSSIAAASLSTWVPKEAGIYKKYGLDVSLIYVAGSQAITTLISGDAQVAQGSGAASILARLGGSEVKIIGNVINVIPMSLVTTPDIAKSEDLKGKTFGVTRFGSLTDLGLRKAVSEMGLEPNKDITMIQTGGVTRLIGMTLITLPMILTSEPPSRARIEAAPEPWATWASPEISVVIACEPAT